MRVRRPAVAGSFYPAATAVLAREVDAFIAEAAPWSAARPKALVVPHAGYAYSGPIAGSGYATIAAGRNTIERIVLLGPAHHVPVDGLAVSSADVFLTPLGAVTVDRAARDRVLEVPGVTVDDVAHAPEHSLEVHLPFLQRVVDRFTVLPLVVGRAAPEAVAAVLDALWGGPETLIVVSTDLSHYLDHDRAVVRDRRTAAAILAGDVEGIGPSDACGAYPVNGLLAAVRRRGLQARLLDLRTSGDTAGSRDRVVGYGTFVFVAKEA